MVESQRELVGKSVKEEPASIVKIKSGTHVYEAAKWMCNNLMIKMDKYAYARGLILFFLLGFLLGNNLGLFLWLHIAITVYLMIYRVLRFWVKKSLMYFIEFCYFGNTLLVLYITVYGENLRLFYTVYISSTGVMALAVIIFKLQAQFNSTDHLTSTYMHIFPMISVWAIRWRDKIYSVDTWSNYFSFFIFNESEIKKDFYLNLIFPLLFWLAWGVFYLLVSSTILSKYIKSQHYENAIKDFIELEDSLKFCLGDIRKNTLIKYILTHFFCFVLPVPIVLLSYKYFWCNTAYIFLITMYLAINSARYNIKHMEKKLDKNENKQNVDKSDNQNFYTCSRHRKLHNRFSSISGACRGPALLRQANNVSK